MKTWRKIIANVFISSLYLLINYFVSYGLVMYNLDQLIPIWSVELINVWQVKKSKQMIEENIDGCDKKDMDVISINKDTFLDKNEQRRIIHVIDLV